jgi:two-component system cell cycle response regulator
MSGEPVLIVEDNEVNLKLFRILLEKGGFDLRIATNAEEALAVLAEFSPRLILMDVQLPGMDGLELTRRLKADSRYRHIVIVALTSYAMKSDEQRARDAGCDGHIAKPIDTRTFLNAVRQAIAAPSESPTPVPQKKLVLVADDDPAQRRLLEIHLTQLGFEVSTAKDGAEALEAARTRCPDVIVTDILMPRIDGFRLAQLVRQDRMLAAAPVILMTSGVIRSGDERMAFDFGANALVPRTGSFDQIVAAIRSALASGPPARAKVNEEIDDLRSRFISEGLRDLVPLLNISGSGSSAAQLKRLVHRWAGTGGTLGLPQVSQAAFEIERLLGRNDTVSHQVLAKLSELHDLFLTAGSVEASNIPGPVAASLGGRQFAAVGFSEIETLRVTETLEGTQAAVRNVSPKPNGSQKWHLFDAVIVNVTEDADTPQPSVLAQITKPLVAIGLSTTALEAALNAHRGEHDFLLRPWSPSELVLRCYAVLGRWTQAARPSHIPADGSRARVLIGEDDPTTVTLLQRTLKNYDVDCCAVSSGGQVLEAVAGARPDLVVLDINMPELDGFEVLSTLKNNAETRDIPVMLLTARQQEADILRGFSLGAEDYVTKPFSPMELVARIKRTLRRVP